METMCQITVKSTSGNQLYYAPDVGDMYLHVIKLLKCAGEMMVGLKCNHKYFEIKKQEDVG